MSYGTASTGHAMFIGGQGTLLIGAGYGDRIDLADFWVVGEWHHITLTYDGSTALLYADGVQVVSGQKNWDLTPNRAHIGMQVNHPHGDVGRSDRRRASV
jgi:hypothetical protein